MKPCLKIIPVILFAIMAGCAGRSQYILKATPTEAPPPGKALVYFMRPSEMGFAINFQIWDGNHFVGLSQAKSYFAYQCNPGKHLFLGFAENKVAIEEELEAGKSYYIGTNVRVGGGENKVGGCKKTRGSEIH